MKTITVEFYGRHLELIAFEAVSQEEYEDDCDCGWITSDSQWALDGFSLKVGDETYEADDLRSEMITYSPEDDPQWIKEWEIETFGVEGKFQTIYGEGDEKIPIRYAGALKLDEFMEANNADYCDVETSKNWGEFELELPDDEEFDPDKVLILYNEWWYPESEEPMISALLYDGKVCQLGVEDGRSNGRSTVIGENPNDEDFDCDEWDDEEDDDANDEE